MDPSRIGLFDVAEKRLAWMAQRQAVLAGNIANVNTPGYRARDLTPFEQMLAGSGTLAPVQTQPNHLAGTLPSGVASLTPQAAKARIIDGNAVAMDEQLTKVADTETAQSLVTSIWKKYVGLFGLALGRSG
jgi:flagellar basal-body rod protein FlgB